MTSQPTDRTNAERLSSDESMTGRLVSDSAEPPEQVPAPRRVTLRSRYEPAWLHTITSKYALVLVWIAMTIVYLILMPNRFGSFGTISSIFGSQQVLVFLAMSAMITLIVGEFDLSIASVMALSATVIPVLATDYGWNIWAACLAGLAACLVVGAINAFFVVLMDVSSFVVTLGMATLLLGITQMISGSTVVSVASPQLSQFALFEVLGLPISFYYGILLALVLAYVLGWTPLGRSMLFVGASPEVARLAGIRVRRIRIGSYLAGAALAGMAGVMIIATVGGFDSSTSGVYLLPALAAVFLGTAVVQPGMFNPIGTMIAIYFLTTGIFGLQLLGVSGWIQNVFYGAGLVVAVTLAKVVRERSKAD